MKQFIFFLAFFSWLSFAFSQEEEFKPFTEDTSIISDTENFKPFSEKTDSSHHICNHTCVGCPNANNNSIDWSWGSTLMITSIALLLTLISGIMVRFEKMRPYRSLMLLIGLIFFGFYNSACPCMISSFQHTILYITGYDTNWINVLWFIGLIPLTYIFGKVWCGWVCHLGAIQEFLFRPQLKHWLTNNKTGLILKIIRYTLIALLIVQLIIMGSIFWCQIDPFKAIFNIQLNYNYEITTLILLILLLVFSVFSFRPFCRTICPVGITLGWISHIPGASIIGLRNQQCISCKACNEACQINAIIRIEKTSFIDNKECIACGDCINSCSQCGLNFLRKNSKNKPVQAIQKCNQ
ncbi:MAG: 4Fe-4S binding protein [Bacteroidales bacterium]|nr:4Fe-4S binding protein [Bacteroidales bacterium]